MHIKNNFKLTYHDAEFHQIFLLNLLVEVLSYLYIHMLFPECYFNYCSLSSSPLYFFPLPIPLSFLLFSSVLHYFLIINIYYIKKYVKPL